MQTHIETWKKAVASGDTRLGFESWKRQQDKLNEAHPFLDRMMNLAAEAITLAEQYSGGESETAQELSKEFAKLCERIDTQNTGEEMDLTHGDYRLADGSGWFETPNGFAVWIRTTPEGIAVDVYDADDLRKGETTELAACYAFTAELKRNNEEEGIN